MVFDYRITDAFLGRGFVELVSEHSPDDLFTFRFPGVDPALGRDDGVGGGAASARVDVDDAGVGLFSDHYPIRCTLELQAFGD